MGKKERKQVRILKPWSISPILGPFEKSSPNTTVGTTEWITCISKTAEKI